MSKVMIFDGALVSNSQSEHTAQTETISAPDVNYEAIILETFKTTLKTAFLSGGQKEVIERFLKIGTIFHSYVFFTDQTQDRLETLIFEDAPLRDMIYNTLVRLKFALKIEKGSIDDLISFIADTGYMQNEYTGLFDEGKFKVSQAQASFDDAYKVAKIDRIRLLYAYEWAIILFLLNMYWLQLLAIVESIGPKSSVKSPNPIEQYVAD